MSRSSALRFFMLSGIWGSSFLFIATALEGLNPAQTVSGRLLAGGAVLLASLLLRRHPFPWSAWPHLLVLAFTANLIPFTLFAWGQERIDSGLSAILNATTPLMTIVIGRLVVPDERLTRTRLLGMVIGFLGVVVIVGPWRGIGGGSLSGQLACLAAASCYGLAFTYTRRLVVRSEFGPVSLAAGQIATAAVLSLAVLPVLGTDAVDLDLNVVAAVVALGGLGTGAAYLIYYRLISEVGAATASAVTYLLPVVAVVLGAVFRDERLTWNALAGAAIVVLGVAIAEGRVGAARARPEPTPLEGAAATATAPRR